MLYFSSDTHFGHANIIKYCKRPFRNIEEMDEKIIENWNSVVNDSDTVYHLGDFSFRDPYLYRKRLKGMIVLIRGNHDFRYLKQIEKKVFESVHDLLSIKVEDTVIVLCHYAMRVWHKSHFNSFHIYGHSHGGLADYGKTYDVGVDNNNFIPISFLQLKQIMSLKPNNPNFKKNVVVN